MKKIWLELDISKTKGNAAWKGIPQPKGYLEAGIESAVSGKDCSHTEKSAHTEGEWQEVWVQIEETQLDEAIEFYKAQDRILAVETEG